MSQLPGDPQKTARTAAIIRVDHAGEYGATRIYAGQLAILGRTASAPALQHMLAQEQAHLKTFETLVKNRQVRPTALLPIWHLAGFALGAATALLGEKAAMACTVAVEDAIDAHYRAQSNELGPSDPELKNVIETFRAEELQHRQTALAHGAEQTPAYRLLHGAIRVGCQIAIKLSEKI